MLLINFKKNDSIKEKREFLKLFLALLIIEVQYLLLNKIGKCKKVLQNQREANIT